MILGRPEDFLLRYWRLPQFQIHAWVSLLPSTVFSGHWTEDLFRHEAIPDNWYKRNLVDYYTIPYLSIDVDTMALAHPQFLSVGGNTGTTNSFVGVDPANLTGGVFTAENLLQGNNAICFGLQASLQEAPDILSGLYSDVNPAVNALGTAVNKATNGLGCPKLNEINENQYSQYPGYTKLKKDGTY